MAEVKGICGWFRVAKIGKSLDGRQLTREMAEAIVDAWREFRYKFPVNADHEKFVRLGWGDEIRLSADGQYLEAHICLDRPLHVQPLGFSIEVVKTKDKRHVLSGIAILFTSPPALPVPGQDLSVLVQLSLEPDTTYRFTFAADSVKIKSRYSLNYPVADPSREWDRNKAVDNLLKHGGYELLSKCVVYYEVHEGDDDPPKVKSRYKFPFCDVVNGTVKIIPRAVLAIKQLLHGGRGYKPPTEEVKRLLTNFVEKADEKIKKEVADMEKMEAMVNEMLTLVRKLAEGEEERYKAQVQEYEKRIKELTEQVEKYRAEIERMHKERVNALLEKYGVKPDEVGEEVYNMKPETLEKLLKGKAKQGSTLEGVDEKAKFGAFLDMIE